MQDVLATDPCSLSMHVCIQSVRKTPQGVVYILFFHMHSKSSDVDDKNLEQFEFMNINSDLSLNQTRVG